jgi:mannose-6-phosphate isomerase-like protein (cupin superfamily)
MRRTIACVAMAGVMAAMTQVGTAQKAPGLDHHSATEVEAQAKTMLAAAQKAPDGVASTILERYPGHFVELIVRAKSGGGELHADWNDVFFILDGEATEVTGGTIVNPKLTAPGETRGTKVEGGTPTVMRKGDLIHIAPGTPHQTILAPGKSVMYYVLKVEKKQ